MELNQVITERRTMREFTDYYVADEDLSELFEAVRWTPSWANTQSWRFLIIRDTELIKKIADQFSKNNAGISCAYNSSALILGSYKDKSAGYRDQDKYTIYDSWGMFDLGLACQTLSLKAHDMGLGTLIVGAMDHQKIKELANIDDELHLAVAICIGKPTQNALQRTAPKRKEVTDFVQYYVK